MEPAPPGVGGTPLIAAASAGQLAIVEGLLGAGADPNAMAPDGITALIAAAARGHHALLRPLVDAGAHLDAKSMVTMPDGSLRDWTAERWAAHLGHGHVLVALRALGGQLAADAAAEWFVRRLLDHGRRVRLTSPGDRRWAQWHDTELHEPQVFAVDAQVALTADEAAPLGGHVNLPLYLFTDDGDEVCFQLAPEAFDAGPDILDASNALVVHLGSTVSDLPPILDNEPTAPSSQRGGAMSVVEGASAGRIAVVRRALAQGLSPESPDAASALCAAAASNRKAIMTLLLEAGVDPRARDAEGWSALHRVAAKGWPETARLLLDRGAVVDEVTPAGETPLWLAAGSSTPAMLELLLEHGADPEAARLDGTSPCASAEAHHRADNVRVLTPRFDHVEAPSEPLAPGTVRWQGTSDTCGTAFRARVNGEDWAIAYLDFAATAVEISFPFSDEEHKYALLVNDQRTQEFDDWPANWVRLPTYGNLNFVDRYDELDETSLHALILREPTNDEARARYAERLERRDDPRGEYIRLSLPGYHGSPAERERYRASAAWARAQELERIHGPTWRAAIAPLVADATLARGFVSCATLSARQLVDGHERIASLAPLRHLDVTDMAGLETALLALPIRPNIRTLKLTGATDALIERLVRLPLPALVWLDLRGSTLGPRAVEAIAEQPALRTRLVALAIDLDLIALRTPLEQRFGRIRFLHPATAPTRAACID